MRIAILISGEPRAIVFKEQLQFFTSLFNSLVKDGHTIDTYCMFKLNPVKDFIQSKEGLSNFSNILELFNPKYLEFFYEFKEDALFNQKFKKRYPPMFFSQIKMIDHLITQAYNNEANYELFLRIRPDCILKGKLDLTNINKDTVYTSVKCDAVGNDQMFICSRKMIEVWWISVIRPSLSYVIDLRFDSSLSPEYFIFYHCPTKQVIESGLIRDYNVIISWITYPENYSAFLNYFKYNEDYLKLKDTMDRNEFLEKLKQTTLKFNGIMNTSIPV